MFTRAIPTTQPADLQRKRRVWPPVGLKEPTNAGRVTPQRWQQPRGWYAVMSWCLVVCLALTVAEPAIAQDSDHIGAGTLHFESASGRVEAPRVHTAVTMQVSGMIARVDVEQQFHNPGDGWVDGIYAFPLPDNAAVNQLRMQVGEREIVGEVREKIEAQQLFKQARSNGQRASVVHQQRPNIFRTAVANIGPRETIHITISYLQIVDQHGGRYSVRFPLTITPRYVPRVMPESVAIAGPEVPVTWVSAQHDRHDTATLADLHPTFSQPDVARQSVSFAITLDVGTAIEKISSAYHAIDVSENADVYHVKLGRQAVAPDRDFELSWTPIVLGTPAAALFREDTGSGEHVLLTFMPPQDATPVAAPREVTFVIDTSGSMAGTSMEQAQASLMTGLATLQPNDRFNIIQFNTDFELLFDGPVAASVNNIRRARRYVDGLKANGGTEMAGALSAAFSMPRSSGHLKQIIFITDGAVSNEVQLMQVIKEGLRDTRLFIVGIGSAPNAHFMRTAAQVGRGTFTFIGSTGEVEQKMGELLRKLTHPVLTDIEVIWPGGVVPEYAPAQLGDLYADEPIMISARLPMRTRGVVTITGRTNQTWTRQLSLDTAEANTGVATLWARNRIADLMSLQALRVSDDHIRAQVMPLALEYQLVSKYTSLVAIDKTPVRRPDEVANAARIDNTKPHGSDWPTAGMPTTATPAQLQLLLGALALLLASAIHLLRVKRTAARP